MRITNNEKMDQETTAIAARRTAFDKLLRDVARKLSKDDQNGIEVLEEVPDEWREKGGVKLLEYLQRQGKFSVWKTSRLRQTLRDIERHDLADNEVKNFQLGFPDINSPATLQRSTSTLLPLTNTHRRVRPSSSSPVLRHPLPKPPPASSLTVPSLYEVHSSQGSLDWQVGSFPSTPSSGRSCTSIHRRLTPDNSPVPHSAQRYNTHDFVQLESTRMAIQALYQIATGSHASLQSYGDNYTAPEEKVNEKGKELSSSLPLEANYLSEAPKFTRVLSCPSAVQDNTESEPTTEKLFPTARQDGSHTPPTIQIQEAEDIQPADIIWQIKRDRLLKSLSKSSEGKPQSVSCGQKIEVDVGQGKNNPKLSTVLYPYGLFDNEGKSASLQVKISIPEKCPPLSPSVQLQLKLRVYSSHKRGVLREALVRKSINLHSFYIHHLFNTNIPLATLGEYILIEMFLTIPQQ